MDGLAYAAETEEPSRYVPSMYASMVSVQLPGVIFSRVAPMPEVAHGFLRERCRPAAGHVCELSESAADRAPPTGAASSENPESRKPRRGHPIEHGCHRYG